MEEPWLKELETHRDCTDTRKKQWQFLEGLYYVDKKSMNNSCGFPEVWNFSKNGLELQRKNSTYIEANLRSFPHMNANLQSRLLRKISFVEKWVLENKNYSVIDKYNVPISENNLLANNPVFWPTYPEEKEKSTLYNKISKQSELQKIGIVFDDILTDSLFGKIDLLFKKLSEFQGNKNGTSCHYTKGEQYYVPKSIVAGKTRNDKTACQCLLKSSILKGRMSEIETLLYRYENAAQKIKIFENPKLQKYDLELSFESERISGYSTEMENNYISFFSKVILFYTPKQEISNKMHKERSTPLSRYSLDYGMFSVLNYNQKPRQHAFSKSYLLQENNLFSSFGNKKLYNPRTTHKLTLSQKEVNYLTLASYINEKLCIKYSNHRMPVTMETCVLKRNRFVSNENNAFPSKKFKFSHFDLRGQKNKVTRFKTTINLTNKCKHAPNWLETYKGQKAVKDRRRKSNSGEYKGSIFGFVDMKHIFSHFETHKKISLNTNTEEMNQIQFLEKIVFNSEKYNKGCSTSDSKITWNVTDVTTNNHIACELFTHRKSLSEEKSKNKMFQYLRHKTINSQSSQYGINDVLVNGLYSVIQNRFSDIMLGFASDIFQNLCIDKNIAVSVKVWHDKIFLPGKTERQTHYLYEANKSILPYVHNSRVSKRRKHPKVKQVENTVFLCQKGNLLSNIYNSKQNAKCEIKVDNERKGNDQPSAVSYVDDEYTNCSEDKLMTTLSTAKQVHFEKAMEGHSSPEIRYKFEMKKQFDSVLEELSMFNEMNKECENSSSGEEHVQEEQSPTLYCSDIFLEKDSGKVCQKQVNTTFPTGMNNTAVMHTTVMKQDKNEANVLKNCTVLKCTGQDEVQHDYSSSSISDEEFLCSSSEEHHEQPFSWKPAFESHAFWKERSCDFRIERGVSVSDGIKRVQPLKTCHGPLRVGLSRKAKLKQLHPYLR